MTDKPWRGHRADLIVYDDYAGPFTKEDLESLFKKCEKVNYLPKLFLTKKKIKYLVEAGYPANMFVCLPKQAIVKEEEE